MMTITIKHKGLRDKDFTDSFYDDFHKIEIDEEATLEEYLCAVFEALKCEGFSEKTLDYYIKKLDII